MSVFLWLTVFYFGKKGRAATLRRNEDLIRLMLKR
nr:MAG TPA: hypothetical protein [Caudoviricetes sp.]